MTREEKINYIIEKLIKLGLVNVIEDEPACIPKNQGKG